MAGTIVADTIQDGAGNSTAMDNAIYGSAKAWVNFNGVTPAVTSSYNVSSVTRQATGQYTITMTNALTDKNYVVVGSCINGTTPTVNGLAIMGGSDVTGTGPNTQTTTVFYVGTFANGAFATLPVNNVVVFR